MGWGGEGRDGTEQGGARWICGASTRQKGRVKLGRAGWEGTGQGCVGEVGRGGLK